MYIYIDKTGTITTQIEHGEPVRQGNELHLVICFDKDDPRINGNSFIEVQSKMKDIHSKWGDKYVFALDKEEEIFRKIKTSEMTYDLINGERYKTFRYSFNNGKIPVTEYTTKHFGKLELLITLFTDTQQDIEDLAEINVSATYGKVQPEVNITRTEYAELMGEIALRVKSDNLKTINGQSLLGSGDIEIKETDITQLTEEVNTLETKYDELTEEIALRVKSDNLKTINGQSILGSGDIEIKTTDDIATLTEEINKLKAEIGATTTIEFNCYMNIPENDIEYYLGAVDGSPLLGVLPKLEDIINNNIQKIIIQETTVPSNYGIWTPMDDYIGKIIFERENINGIGSHAEPNVAYFKASMFYETIYMACYHDNYWSILVSKNGEFLS